MQYQLMNIVLKSPRLYVSYVSNLAITIKTREYGLLFNVEHRALIGHSVGTRSFPKDLLVKKILLNTVMPFQKLLRQSPGPLLKYCHFKMKCLTSL